MYVYTINMIKRNRNQLQSNEKSFPDSGEYKIYINYHNLKPPPLGDLDNVVLQDILFILKGLSRII